MNDTPAEERARYERFARTLDAHTARGTDSPGSDTAEYSTAQYPATQHPATAADPVPDTEADTEHRGEFGRELAIVDALRQLGEQTTAGRATRERIAARIDAGAPGARRPNITDPTPPRPRTGRNRPGRIPRTGRKAGATGNGPAGAVPEAGHRDKRAGRTVVLAATLCALLALPALLLARDAAPGEALYAVKRAAEQAELLFQTDDEGRARTHLAFANRRIDELATLTRDGGAEPAAYRDVLTAFHDEATTGTADLTPAATNSTGTQLSWLREWAGRQQDRLRPLLDRLPPGTTGPGFHSISLLTRIEVRSRLLWQRMDCVRITSGRTDDLGDMPATGPCTSRRSTGPSPGPTDPAPAEPGGDPVEVSNRHPGEPSRSTLRDLPPAEPAVTPREPTPIRTEPPAPPKPAVPATPSLPQNPGISEEPTIRVPLPVHLARIEPILPGLPEIRVG